MATLRFAGRTIKGTALNITRMSPELQSRRVKYWDVKGEAEIVGDIGGRDIVVDFVMHNGWNRHRQLRQELDKLERQIGTHGEVEYIESGDGTIDGVLIVDSPNSTLHKVEMMAWPNQEKPGPLKDTANTLLDANGEPDGGWFQLLQLTFRQLIV